MGRANGQAHAAKASRAMSRAASRRRVEQRRAMSGGSGLPMTAASTESSETFATVVSSAQTSQMLGAVAALASGPRRRAGGKLDAEAERRAAFALAGDMSRATLPLLAEAQVRQVPSLRAAALEQPFLSNREAIRFASAAPLPAPVTFYDFRPQSDAGWLLTNPEPLRFDGVLAWREGRMLSVMPFWAPFDRDGKPKRDPDDGLGGGPVMRVVFGPEGDVTAALRPGTLGGSSEDGALYCWDGMPEGGEHSRAADRSLRCALRFIDVLAATGGRQSPRTVAEQPKLSVVEDA